MNGYEPGRVRGRLTGLFVMENSVGHRTVYENMKAAARGTSSRVELVDLGARSGLGKLPLPGSVACALTARATVHRLVNLAGPSYLVSNVHNPVLLCHDLVARLPTAIMLDATPRQFDRLAYFVDHSDRVPGIRGLKYLMVRSLFRRARALLAYSSWAARSLIDEYGIPAERVVVAPPGIDTQAWSPANKPARPVPELLFVGGDFERKGGPELLDWFRRAGRGRASLTLVTRARVVEEPGLRVAPAEPNSAALRELVRGADLFVLPTRADTWGNAILEAMASGVPVVTTNVGAIPELVEHGVTGTLVPPGDADALEAALEPLLSSEPLRREMGAAARERVVAHFYSRRAFARIAAAGAAIAAGRLPSEASGAGPS